jgi:phytoene/squalene synthetase
MNELKQFDVKAAEILERKYSDRFTALMRFQAERAHRTLRRGARALGEADRAAQKPGADDGQHLPQPAARDRGRGFRGAAPADLADADQEALDRDADQLARR